MATKVKESLPERRTEIFSLGSKIKVTIQPETSNTKNCFEDTFFGGTRFGGTMYSIETALENTLSAEEVAERDDPNCTSDYFLDARPEVHEDADPLTEYEIRTRYEKIRDYYRLLADDSIVQAIVDSIPRDESGGLRKRSYTRIAIADVVDPVYHVFEIIGYAKNDKLLQIYAKWMELEKEVAYLGNDFFSLNPQLLSGETKSTSVMANFLYVDDSVPPKKVGLKVSLVSKGGMLYLGNTPVSSFKCLKEDSIGNYSVVVDDSSYQSLADTEIKGAIIVNKVVGPWLVDALSCLEKYRYATAGDERCAWQKLLHEKYDHSRKWPEGVERYHGDFSKEQSLEKLLLFVDKICSYSREDLLSIIERLPMNKNKKNFTPHKRYRLLTSDFFAPKYNKGYPDPYNMCDGGFFKLVVSTPLEAPLRYVRFQVSMKSYIWPDPDIELPFAEEEPAASFAENHNIPQQKKNTAEKNSLDDFEIQDGKLLLYKGRDGYVTIPDCVNDISHTAFYDNRYVKHVVIGQSVQGRLFNCFNGCKNLETVELPEGITEVSFFAVNCRKLRTVKLPQSLLHLGTNAFEACTQLRNLQLHEGLKVLDIDAFDGCTALEEVLIPYSVERINLSLGFGSFTPQINNPIRLQVYSGSPAEKELEKFDKNDVFKQNFMVERIQRDFQETSEIHTTVAENESFEIEGDVLKKYQGRALIVTIPDGVTEIGERAFANNLFVRKIVLPESTTKIGYSAFGGCQFLEEINLPPAVISLGVNAFWNCTGLKKIEIPPKIKVLDKSTFYGCTALEEVTLPAKLTKLSYSCFYGCSSLKTIELPKTLKTIGQHAFSNSGLISITIPPLVKILEESSFSLCLDLKDVYLPAGLKNDENISAYDVFYDSNSVCLHVVSKSAAEQWVKYSGKKYVVE